MLNFILGLLIGGPIGWCSNLFVGTPIKSLSELRIEARIVMDMTANTTALATPRQEEYKQAVQTIRGIGVQIGAIDETAWPPVRWWFRIRGYDLNEAKGALIGLSNALLENDGSRAVYRYEAEKALKLKMSYSEKPIIRDS